MYGLRQAARDWVWLYDLRHGVGMEAIARRDGVDLSTVYDGVRRARGLERSRPSEVLAAAESQGDPRVVPLFPVGAFTPASACPHSGPVGPSFCCMVCHETGARVEAKPDEDASNRAASRPRPARRDRTAVA